MFPFFSSNLPIECFEFAFFEQYKERLDIKLVSSVNPIPKTCFLTIWSTLFFKSGISEDKPIDNLLTISLRKTPDLVQGSKNVTFLLDQIISPLCVFDQYC